MNLTKKKSTKQSGTDATKRSQAAARSAPRPRPAPPLGAGPSAPTNSGVPSAAATNSNPSASPEGLPVDILPQPTDETCGPTCLHAVYRQFGIDVPLRDLIAQTEMLPTGGTLAVNLACHALEQGLRATIYTFDLHLFDPSWFDGKTDIAEKLHQQLTAKRDRKLRIATNAYLRYLELGGVVKFEDLTANLLRRPLKRRLPILVGLSATYLYHSVREIGETNEYDDLLGEPAGHFVVVNGYRPATREAEIADPLAPNPLMGVEQYYAVPMHRLIGAILLGIVTYDANLLILEPQRGPAVGPRPASLHS